MSLALLNHGAQQLVQIDFEALFTGHRFALGVIVCSRLGRGQTRGWAPLDSLQRARGNPERPR